jgi:non-specific serine/threonine protein kinase
VLRRPAIYVTALVVGAAAYLAGLPVWAAGVIAVLSLLGGAALAAAVLARRDRRPPAIDERVRPAAPTEAVFRLEGEFWTIAFNGSSFALSDAKGLRYIHRLLQTPGMEVHVLELERVVMPSPASPRNAGAPPDTLTPQPILDDRAIASFRARIKELQEEIEEAERNNDHERASRAREELEALTAEIQRTIRPGDKSRDFTDETQRARVNVQRAIRGAVERVRDHDPSLGHHLDHDITTGTYCVYAPDPSSAPAWAL